MNKNKKTVIILLIAAILIGIIPLFVLKGAKFSGSDDAGSTAVEQTDPDYKPWFAPVLETLIGGELPSEMESLFFCVQTGIGTGIIFFFIGRFYERKKLGKQDEDI